MIVSFGYDATGNRRSYTVGSTTTSFGYPATSHRLQQVGSQARGFDAAGNTLSGIPGYETQSARYDARNRLVEIGSGRQAQWRAQYNGRGERVLYAEGDPAPELPERERGNDWKKEGARATVYDEQGQVLSWLHSGRKLSFEEIIWIDSTPVGRVTSSTSAVTEVHAIHTDHLNTPRALVNAQTQGGQPAGTVVWRWRLVNQGTSGSNAFGAMAAEEDPDGNGTTVRFDLRFPGQQYDASTGLHYNYFRDYEAQTGRYVESDPIGLRGGANTYGYVVSAPLRYVDRFGLRRGTIVCNGGGGYRPKIETSDKCIAECVYRHEMVHVDDWSRWFPDGCKNKRDGEEPDIRDHAFVDGQGGDWNPHFLEQFNESECKASAVSIECARELEDLSFCSDGCHLTAARYRADHEEHRRRRQCESRGY